MSEVVSIMRQTAQRAVILYTEVARAADPIGSLREGLRLILQDGSFRLGEQQHVDVLLVELTSIQPKSRKEPRGAPALACVHACRTPGLHPRTPHPCYDDQHPDDTAFMSESPGHIRTTLRCAMPSLDDLAHNITLITTRCVLSPHLT